MLSTLAVYFSRYPSHELAKSKERTQAQFKTFVAFLAAIQRVDAPVSHGKTYPPALSHQLTRFTASKRRRLRCTSLVFLLTAYYPQ
jgi:hypothetical protein